MNTPALVMALPLLAGLVLGGCASTPKPTTGMKQVRAELNELKADPAVQSHAATPLLNAEQALNRADKANEKGQKAERDHQVYLAQQQLALARAQHQSAASEEQIKQLGDERERLSQSALARQRQELAEQERELEEAQRQLESDLAAMEAKRTDRGMLVTLDDVFFSTGGSLIAPGATPTLDKVVEFLERNPEQQIVVEGHTDSTGSDALNQRLSIERANAVKDRIVTSGIEPDRVLARGYGSSRPVASNESPGGRQLNRRVEIVFPDLQP